MEWTNGFVNTGTSVNIIIDALVVRFLIFFFDFFRSAREKREFQLRFCATIVRFINRWRSEENNILEFLEFASRSVSFE